MGPRHFLLPKLIIRDPTYSLHLRRSGKTGEHVTVAPMKHAASVTKAPLRPYYYKHEVTACPGRGAVGR
jgi:hypothetical protein